MSRTSSPTRRRRWSRLQRFVVGLLAVAVVAVFAAAGYLWWTERRIERIPSTDLAALAPLPGGDELTNVLVVGTDDRSTLPEDWDLGYYGRFSGRRADVIMVAHLVPGERIQLLSIPRDLKVSIPGHGTNRINAAYVVGGPDLLIEVVQAELGIPIHHYVEVDFAGVGAIVDALGGVTLEFDTPARDPKSGFRTDGGMVTLDGEQAVAYARSRHLEVLVDGEWRSTRGGDIARTGRQREILVALFERLASPKAAIDVATLLPTIADQITADERLTLAVMADLAAQALRLRPDDVEGATLPVRNTRGGDGRAYVEPTDEAAAVVDAFVAGEPYP
ncbi:MAG TPA: LytR family transcriptional regulator [Actinobacteria bacterium]|nr:LytR family transcriptional regulator [Actinomycetota bacterium]